MVRWLKSRVPDTVTVMEYGGDGVGLMALWQGSVTVILVDAVRSGARPGTLHRYDAIRTVLLKDTFACSSHLIGLAQAVELARSLDRLPERLIVYGIEGMNFQYGEGLAPSVARAVEQAGQCILAELAEL